VVERKIENALSGTPDLFSDPVAAAVIEGGGRQNVTYFVGWRQISKKQLCACGKFPKSIACHRVKT
jgi:hypothetical protein